MQDGATAVKQEHPERCFLPENEAATLGWQAENWEIDCAPRGSNPLAEKSRTQAWGYADPHTHCLLTGHEGIKRMQQPIDSLHRIQVRNQRAARNL